VAGRALEVCRGLSEGANVLCMIPDTGERYLSTPLFEDVPADMTEEEVDLSRSTPGYRFDAPAPPPAPAEKPSVPESVDPAAAAFVADAIADAREPVVLFALEWCEFCWSLRRLFARLRIPFRSIDLDSVDFQRDDLGGRIRTALAARTGVKTIPQLFVGGGFVGGCTDTLDAWRNGRLQDMLEKAGTEFDHSAEVDPYAFLPRWLQPR
jgi:cysteine synthase A